MVRFLVLYPEPTDREAFDRHYFGVHIPLAKRLPGLRSYEISHRPRMVRGAGPFYLVAELMWDSMASLQQDFSSPLGHELSKDVEELTKFCPGVQSMIYEPQPTTS